MPPEPSPESMEKAREIVRPFVSDREYLVRNIARALDSTAQAARERIKELELAADDSGAEVLGLVIEALGPYSCQAQPDALQDTIASIKRLVAGFEKYKALATTAKAEERKRILGLMPPLRTATSGHWQAFRRAIKEEKG